MNRLFLLLFIIIITVSCNDNDLNNELGAIEKVGDLTFYDKTDTNVKLTWKHLDHITGYNIYRNQMLIGSTIGTSYMDHELNPNTNYTYQVAAFNNNNEGEKSDELLITTNSESDADYTFVFVDDFEGNIDNSFWLGDGIYVDYGIEDPTHACNKIMKMKYVFNSEGAGDSWSEYDFALPIQATAVEMSFDMYTPANYYHFENNHKLYALWSGTYGKSNANISVSSEMWGTSNGATPSIYVGVDQNNYGHATHPDNPLILEDFAGSWSSYKIILKLAEQNGSYGSLELYKDDVLIISSNDPGLIEGYSGAPLPSEAIHYAETGNYIDQGTLLGWANGDSDRDYDQDIEFYIDNFEIKAKE